MTASATDETVRVGGWNGWLPEDRRRAEPALLHVHLARDVPGASEGEQVIEIIEVELGPDPAAIRADPDARAEGLLEGLLGSHQCGLLVRMGDDLWTARAADLLGSALRLSYRPAASGRLAGE